MRALNGIPVPRRGHLGLLLGIEGGGQRGEAGGGGDCAAAEEGGAPPPRGREEDGSVHGEGVCFRVAGWQFNGIGKLP